jgi:alcohol dehydrogenase (cytochrome c)
MDKRSIFAVALAGVRAGAGVIAPPSTYMVDGKQYVVVGAGGNTQIDFRRGNNIIAFSLN